MKYKLEVVSSWLDLAGTRECLNLLRQLRLQLKILNDRIKV